MNDILKYSNGDIYQWDSGLSLTVNGQLIDEAGTQYVHYQHKGKSAVYSVAVTDGMAAIPNELLQVPGAFNAYAYVLDESNGKTLVCREFRIVPRPQPPEYIYDPTPVITYPELVQLVEDLTILKTKLTMVDAMAETLPSGELATATVDDSGDGMTFIFGIPRGKDGKDAVVDPTLSRTGEAADAAATGAALSAKMDKVNPTGSGTFELGTNVEAVSPSSIAQGDNTKAGGKAFTITAVSGGANARVLTLDSVEGLAVGMSCSAYVKDSDDAHTDNFDNFGTITAISGNDVTFSGGFTWSWTLDSEQSSHLWVVGQPELGTRVIGDFAIALGRDNIAQNEQTLVSGRDNVASGKYAVATGRQNKAVGYASRADGRGNMASGKYAEASGRDNLASGMYARVSGYQSFATGTGSHAQNKSTASGQYASSEGFDSTASGAYSHGEGYQSQSTGAASHAEGSQTEAKHEAAHVEGLKTVSGRAYQHVAGKYNVVDPKAARVTGWGTSTNRKNIEVLDTNGNLTIGGDLYLHSGNDNYSVGAYMEITDEDISALQQVVDNLPVERGIATGSLQQKREAETFEVFDNDNIRNNTDIDKNENGEVITGAHGEYSTSLGKSQAKGKRSVAEGVETVALGRYSHAEGNQTFTKEPNAHAEGVVTSALGFASHSEGSHTEAQGSDSHSEGTNTTAQANSSHVQNRHSHAKGIASHAEGFYSVTGKKDSGGGDDPSPTPTPTPDPAEQAYDEQYGGYAAHAEGYGTNASGRASHSEGYYTKATGQDSHAEGGETTASGLRSHAEGEDTTSSGEASHAEGKSTNATGTNSHAEGQSATASGFFSHAEGKNTSAGGYASHAEGVGTIANGRGQHAAGRFNVANDYLLRITGNGSDDNSRSNAEALDDQGNYYLRGSLTLGANADSTGGVTITAAQLQQLLALIQ